MTHGINDPPGRLSLQRQRQAGEIARLNQRIAELEAALQKLYDAVVHDGPTSNFYWDALNEAEDILHMFKGAE
jgi:hypothetical protein